MERAGDVKGYVVVTEAVRVTQPARGAGQSDRRKCLGLQLRIVLSEHIEHQSVLTAERQRAERLGAKARESDAVQPLTGTAGVARGGPDCYRFAVVERQRPRSIDQSPIPRVEPGLQPEDTGQVGNAGNAGNWLHTGYADFRLAQAIAVHRGDRMIAETLNEGRQTRAPQLAQWSAVRNVLHADVHGAVEGNAGKGERRGFLSFRLVSGLRALVHGSWRRDGAGLRLPGTLTRAHPIDLLLHLPHLFFQLLDILGVVSKDERGSGANGGAGSHRSQDGLAQI